MISFKQFPSQSCRGVSDRFGAARHLLEGLNLPESVAAFNAEDEAIAAEFEESMSGRLVP
ncbi:MAG: hypothetical protein ACRYGL_06050 [Janthinobacterium lividum]